MTESEVLNEVTSNPLKTAQELTGNLSGSDLECVEIVEYLRSLESVGSIRCIHGPSGSTDKWEVV